MNIMDSLIHLSSTSFLRALVLVSGVLVAVPLVPAEARAQVRPDIPDPSDTIYEVRLSDGTVTFARIVAVDQEMVALTTTSGGHLEIERSHIFVLASGVLLVAVPLARAQVPAPSDTIYEVRLSDGTVVFAKIVAVDQEMLTLTTISGGRLEVERSHIAALSRAAGEVVNGEFWNEDPSGTRLLFTATGRTLRQGESFAGTYVAYVLPFPFAAVGLTDRFMIGAGAPVLLKRLEPFYIAPKVLIVDGPSAHISVGTLHVLWDGESAGVAYGVGTFGSTDRALSVGLGYFYSGEDLYNKPAFMFGGETRISRQIKLISENYILPERVGYIFSGGIRIIGDRIAAEVAVAGLTSDGDSECCLPLVSFTYALGN